MEYKNTSIGGTKAQANAPLRILPKRKRKETSYYPSDSDESDTEAGDTDVYDSDAGNLPQAKRVKDDAVDEPAPLLKTQIFPFTSLPAELKNRIYDYALTTEYEIPLVSRTIAFRRTVGLGDNDSFQAFRRRGIFGRWSYRIPRAQIVTIPVTRPSFAPRILSLNRQIHAETQPILYSANVFTFEDTKTLLAFCANIGPKNCATLQELSIKHWGNTAGGRALNFPCFAMLASAVDLTSLNLDCHIRWGRGDRIARQFFRDGHIWLEAVGTNKGRRDAAVDVIHLGLENLYPYPMHGRQLANCTQEEQLEEMTRQFRAELRKLLRA
ncbi:MAG: hypothetical protein Q9209_002216 [Squamulea sp. 1 TL-2023]